MTTQAEDQAADAATRRARGFAHCRARRFKQGARAFAGWAQAGGGAEAMLFQARALLLGGERQRAQDACRQALAMDPTLLRGHLLLARIALLRGNAGSAIQHLRNTLALRPDHASLRGRLAGLLLERGQIDAALRTGREALALDPGCLGAALVLARCHLRRGDLTRARVAAARLAELRPEWEELRAFRAEAGVEPPAPVAVQPATPGSAPGPGPVPVPIPQPPRLPDAPALRARIPPPGLIDHLLILRALILRNLQLKYQGNMFGLALELVRPVTVIVAHYVLFDLLHKPMPGQIPIAAFVLAGFSVWFAFNYTVQGAIGGAKWPGGATLLPGVTAMHLRLARAAWPLLVNLVFCLTAILPFRLLGADLPLPNLPATMLIFAIAGAMGLGFGLFVERMGQVWSIVRPIEKLSIWALFVTCGLYFVVDRLLPVLAVPFLWNPILHLVEFERHAFDPGYPIALVDLRYPVVVAAALLLLGLAACRAIRAPA